MKIRRRRDGAVVVSEIPQPVRLALLRLPLHLQISEGDSAHARLFPNPGGDADLGELWAEWVRPDLAKSFDTAERTVGMQLRRALGKESAEAGLIITPPLRDAWMHVLNRARLAIFERHDFSEEELEVKFPGEITTERDLLRWELAVYQVLLEVLVDAECEP